MIGKHGGRSGLGKARSLISRLHALRAWAPGRNFDVALAHGSHDLTLTARRLGIPSATTFDYEYAWLQHQLGCRAATRVVVPEAIPPERLERYGVRTPKLGRYPGLKEEYYLADFEPDPAALGQFELDPARTLVVVRTPPDVSLYHRRSNELFPQVLDRLGRDESVHAIVIPRTSEQRAQVLDLGLPSLLVPERAVDGQSLVASADLNPRLHDLRRTARRGGRDADPRRAADAAHRPGQAGPPQAGRQRRACPTRPGVLARPALRAMPRRPLAPRGHRCRSARASRGRSPERTRARRSCLAGARQSRRASNCETPHMQGFRQPLPAAAASA